MPQRTYKRDLADEICERIAAGEGLATICRDPVYPPESTFRLWVRDDVDGLAARYARAREMQADHYADSIIAIADTEDDPNKARIRIEARKWIAGKVRPKVYGDKIDVEHGGEIGIRKVEVQFVRPDPKATDA